MSISEFLRRRILFLAAAGMMFALPVPRPAFSLPFQEETVDQTEQTEEEKAAEEKAKAEQEAAQKAAEEEAQTESQEEDLPPLEELGETAPPPATEPTAADTEELAPLEDPGEAAPSAAGTEELAPLEDLDATEAVPPPAAPEEKVVEAVPAPPTEEEKPEEEKDKGLTFWKDRIRVRGVAMARVTRVFDPAIPFSGTTLLPQTSPFVRYTNENPDGAATISDIPHLGVSATADFTPNWQAHIHLGFNPQLPDAANYNRHYDDNGKVSILGMYVRLKIHSEYFKQPFIVRAGRISPWRFSAEHQTPMRTSRYLVTPSPMSAFLNNIYGIGMDVTYGFEPGKNPLGAFALGVLEGNKYYTLPFDDGTLKHYWPLTDVISDPAHRNSAVRGRPGFYGYVTVRDGSGQYRASGGYYWNGVPSSETEGYTTRVSFGTVEAHWKFAEAVFQIMNAETLFREPVFTTSPFDIGGVPIRVPLLKYDGFYFLIRVPFAKKHEVAIRYDEFTVRYDTSSFTPATSNAYLFDYAVTLWEHHKFSFEYAVVDTTEWSLGNTLLNIPQQDAGDDFALVNYTFSF